jgi:hypothetical protein
MKRIVTVLCACLGLGLAGQSAKADDFSRELETALRKAGEEFCLGASKDTQAFAEYFFSPLNFDWVAYYRSSGTAVLPLRPNCTCCWDSKCSNFKASTQRIQFAPVFVSPTMQWAVPNTYLTGPPADLTAGMMDDAPLKSAK